MGLRVTKDPFVQLTDDVQESMNDFIGRLARARRISRVSAPDFMRNLRDEYIESIRKKQHTEACEVIGSFVRSARSYHERIKANVSYVKHWTAYEDQRLRKPIARLARLHAESQKWEAMRRLRSPTHQFVQLQNGQKVAITDMTHAPLYDTFVPAPKPRLVAHDVLVAAGLYRKSPSQFPRT